MRFLVSIEGIKIEATPISNRQLFSVWKKLTCKPYPKVKAFLLSDYDFDRVIHLRGCEEDELRELEEWNTILTTEGTDACVFNVDDITVSDFMVLIRVNHYHKLEDILKHELSHIARGDL